WERDGRRWRAKTRAARVASRRSLPLGPARSYAARATPQRINQHANDRIEARRKTGDFLITPPVTGWGDTEAWFATCARHRLRTRRAARANAKGVGTTPRGRLSLRIPDTASHWGAADYGPLPPNRARARQHLRAP